MHLDFQADDLGSAVAEAVTLGATVADFQPQGKSGCCSTPLASILRRSQMALLRRETGIASSRWVAGARNTSGGPLAGGFVVTAELVRKVYEVGEGIGADPGAARAAQAAPQAGMTSTFLAAHARDVVRRGGAGGVA
jgi:hypothetical protein